MVSEQVVADHTVFCWSPVTSVVAAVVCESSTLILFIEFLALIEPDTAGVLTGINITASRHHGRGRDLAVLVIGGLNPVAAGHSIASALAADGVAHIKRLGIIRSTATGLFISR
jgi:hypothetical protein